VKKYFCDRCGQEIKENVSMLVIRDGVSAGFLAECGTVDMGWPHTEGHEVCSQCRGELHEWLKPKPVEMRHVSVKD
jgi:hypothetical protein